MRVEQVPFDYIADAITEAFGGRCPDFVEGCACCEAWKQYDDLKGRAAEGERGAFCEEVPDQ